MDTSKQRQTSTDTDTSDDLIAELARLVAQDARPENTGAPQRRVEPGFATERSESAVEAEPGPHGDIVAGSGEPEVAAQAELEEQGADNAVAPVFDFGFGTAHKVAQAKRETDRPAQQPKHDPIADLIAGAEAEQPGAERGEDDGDLFEAPPVATTNTAPRANPDMAATRYNAGQRDRDPLSEIEALIGEAARVSAAGVGGRRVRSAFLDEDQDPQTVERAVDMAEESMRVANEARNRNDDDRKQVELPIPDMTQVEFSAGRSRETNPGKRDDSEHVEAAAIAPARERRRSGGFLIPALGGAAIFVLLAGTYVLFFPPHPETGEPPVLTADSGPLKEEPEQPASGSTASDSVVFNEMSGTANSDGEALVSRDETGGVTGNAVSSLITNEDGVGELVNRSVRTVTVRPDGTIVSSDDGVAGGTVLPVDRPDVPALSDDTAGEDPIGDAIVAAIGDDVAAGSPSTNADAAETPAENEATTAGVDDPNAPQPIPRPEGLVASNVTAPNVADLTGSGQTTTAPQAATAGAAAAQSATSTTATNAGSAPAAWVQLASQRSEEVARAGVSDLQARYGPLFNGAVPEVSRVDLGDRGIYYRVRLPQPTLADANAVCDAIKGQGGDCFVLNN
ncbi:SPOR domain-containing protein [Pelagibacterium halotolerans]|uniref:SPOR domain-containing protein n=1 Tax=Pelagibacterium halotolerans TaxID=531813 RepID=UPI00384E6D5B